jgi:hypothetical protein
VNHFNGLIILTIGIAAVFAVINKDGAAERFRHFLSLLGYMVVGSLIAVWAMHFIPW